tara:strand:+ start:359 stop:781 length:423 start_codon:yes stop_codon:yes gene_type:complete
MKNNNNKARRESWVFWKEMIRFLYEYELNEDGFVRRNATKSQLTKAKRRWKDWRDVVVLENDKTYMRNMELLVEEYRSTGKTKWRVIGKDGTPQWPEFGRRQAALQEMARKRNNKRTYEYEKSIGISNSEFAERRRRRAA